MLGGEERARAEEARLDLVGDERDALAAERSRERPRRALGHRGAMPPSPWTHSTKQAATREKERNGAASSEDGGGGDDEDGAAGEGGSSSPSSLHAASARSTSRSPGSRGRKRASTALLPWNIAPYAALAVTAREPAVLPW